MNIYRFESSLTATGGSANSFTLRIGGGLLRQFLVRANTSTTVFRADLQEYNRDGTLGQIIVNYDYSEGEINDIGSGNGSAVPIPLYGAYQLNITNATVNDTFNVRLMVQE